MNNQKVSTGTTSIERNRSGIKKVSGFVDDQSENSGVEKVRRRAQKILEVLLSDSYDYTIPELMLLLKTLNILEPAMLFDTDSYIIVSVKEVISELLYCELHKHMRQEG